MKIVIDIPEEVYKRVVVSPRCTPVLDAFEDRDLFVKALQSGTPLPKGHGALKDADKLAVAIAIRRDNWNYYGNEYESAKFETYDICVDEIIDAPTIIEADSDKDNPN